MAQSTKQRSLILKTKGSQTSKFLQKQRGYLLSTYSSQTHHDERNQTLWIWSNGARTAIPEDS
eukprot:12414282-Karenia_brevis.AAC.1